jgi:hypothetical protein
MRDCFVISVCTSEILRKFLSCFGFGDKIVLVLEIKFPFILSKSKSKSKYDLFR